MPEPDARTRGDGHVRWGILGTGKIARHFAASLRASATGRLAAVASRTPQTADAFRTEFGAYRSHGTYAAALADPDIDIVYVATPHPTHLPLIQQAAEHGKHVLCEKPLTVNAAEARVAIASARTAGVLLAEGFAFRYHPQTRRLTDLVSSGALGEVTLIEAAFGYDAGPAPTNYLLRNDLAGGSILDVGCYPVAMSRLLAGVVAGRPFDDPVRVTGGGFVHPAHRVDTNAAASLYFGGGLVAHVRTAIDRQLDGTLRVYGTEGVATLTDPWLPGRREPSILTLRSRTGDGVATEIHAHAADPDLYANEADEVAGRLSAGEVPAMGLDDTLGNMLTLDEWRRQLGLEYPADVAA